MTPKRYFSLVALLVAFLLGLAWALSGQYPGPVKWQGSSGNYQSERK